MWVSARTFCRFASLAGCPGPRDRAETLADLLVGLIGIPMDLAVTNRNGSSIGPYNDGLDVAFVQEMRVADTGDVSFGSRFSLATSHADIEAHLHKVCSAGVLPLPVGGDQSISHPILCAVGRGPPVGMIRIDALSDTGSQFDRERFHLGAPVSDMQFWTVTWTPNARSSLASGERQVFPRPPE